MTAQQGSLINQDLKSNVEAKAQENDKQHGFDGYVLDATTSIQISLSVEKYNALHPENPMDDVKVKKIFIKYGVIADKLKIWRDVAVLKEQPKEQTNNICGKYAYVKRNDQQSEIILGVIEMWEAKCREKDKKIAWLSNKLHKEWESK
eukprot:177791_1